MLTEILKKSEEKELSLLLRLIYEMTQNVSGEQLCDYEYKRVTM